MPDDPARAAYVVSLMTFDSGAGTFTIVPDDTRWLVGHPPPNLSQIRLTDFGIQITADGVHGAPLQFSLSGPPDALDDSQVLPDVVPVSEFTVNRLSFNIFALAGGRFLNFGARLDTLNRAQSTAVPEPATLLIVAVGLGHLRLRRGLRRR